LRDIECGESKELPHSDRASMLEDFLALSRILTGVENLDTELGRQYLDRLTSTPFEPFLRQVIELFRGLKKDKTLADKVKSQILGNDALRPAICQIILLWYTSAMQDDINNPGAMRYGTQEEYFSGLAWSLIGAHVPGLSGGYFGHWRYRPDNEPLEDA
jgi:hypothetical protein